MSRQTRETVRELLVLVVIVAGGLALSDGVFDRIGVREPSAVESYLETYDYPGERGASAVADRESDPPLVILVTDMGGSTELLERLGDEAARELMRTHNRIVRACIHEHFGAEVQQTGDGFLTYFFSALDAIGCAVTVQRSLERYNAEHSDLPIRVRIGMTAGRPLPDEGRLVGVAVNAAARVCGHANPGQILVSDAVAPPRSPERFPGRPSGRSGRATPLGGYPFSPLEMLSLQEPCRHVRRRADSGSICPIDRHWNPCTIGPSRTL